jgi:hypothetical protein
MGSTRPYRGPNGVDQVDPQAQTTKARPYTEREYLAARRGLRSLLGFSWKQNTPRAPVVAAASMAGRGEGRGRGYAGAGRGAIGGRGGDVFPGQQNIAISGPSGTTGGGGALIFNGAFPNNIGFQGAMSGFQAGQMFPGGAVYPCAPGFIGNPFLGMFLPQGCQPYANGYPAQ